MDEENKTIEEIITELKNCSVQEREEKLIYYLLNSEEDPDKLHSIVWEFPEIISIASKQGMGLRVLPWVDVNKIKGNPKLEEEYNKSVSSIDIDKLELDLKNITNLCLIPDLRNALLSTRRDEVLQIIKQREDYNFINGRLLNALADDIIDPDFKFDGNTNMIGDFRATEYNTKLFEISYKNDPEATIRFIATFNINSYFFAPKFNEDVIWKYIDGSTFKIKKEEHLNNPILLRKSLENDYKHTIKFIAQHKPAFLEDSIKQVIMNNFVLNDDCVSWIVYDSTILNQSYKNDSLATVECLIKNNKHRELIKFVNEYHGGDFSPLIDDLVLLKDKFTTRDKYFYAQLINDNPKLLNALFTKDYDAGLKLLSACGDFAFGFNDEVVDIVKEELTKHNWVPSNVGNNKYLLQYMFVEAVKNNPRQTLKYFSEVFLAHDFQLDYLNNRNELSKIFIDVLSQENCTGVKTILEFSNLDNEILLGALKNNYTNTINNISQYALQKNSFNKTYSFRFDQKNQSELTQYLTDNNFVLDERNFRLISINPGFLIASLKNDYEKTIGILERILKTTKTEYSDEEYEEIYNILKSKGREEDFAQIARVNIELFKKQLEKDFDAAMKALDGFNPVPKLHDQDVSDILEKYGEKLDFKKHPNLVDLFAYGVFEGNNLSDSDIKEAIDLGFPLSFIPFKSIDQLAPYLNSEEEKELFDKIYFNGDSYEYSEEDEQTILKMLNSQFDCLEDEFAYMFNKNITRKQMSPTQLLAIALYAKKDQAQKNIHGYSVEIFGYSDDIESLGTQFPNKKVIALWNGNDSKISSMLKTIMHENNHARQGIDISNCDVDNDRKVVAYSKDELLRDFLRNEYNVNYYEINYWHFAIEHDAELKAQLQLMHVLRIDEDKQYQIDGEEDDIKFLNDGENHNKYGLSGKRIFRGEKYDLDKLFEVTLPRIIEKGFYTIEQINEKYPVVKFEYNLDESPVRKFTLEELVDKYINADLADRKVYLAVLAHKMNPLYNDKHQEVTDSLETILKEKGFSDEDMEFLIKDSRGEMKLIRGQIVNVNITLGEDLRNIRRYLSEDRSMKKDEFNKRSGR